MLHPYRTQYQTNSLKALHLGDLVNIYQQCSGGTLFSETICPCCGNDAGDVFRLLCELNSEVKFGRLYGEPTPILPWWFREATGQRKHYRKAIGKWKKGSHVVVQLDARSRGHKVPDWSHRVVELLKGAVNIGDKPLSCRNACDETLRSKFDLIATARMYVGIDSGLTHLALMTDTPVVLIHPPSWDVSRFYPQTSQATQVSDFKQMRNYLIAGN